LYDVSSFQKKEEKEKLQQKTGYVYARVSSPKQKKDLDRQIQTLQKKYPQYIVITDIGSGINFRRKGLQKLLQHASQGLVAEVVVTHRDRLCRFAFELLEYVFSLFQTRLLVLNKDEEQQHGMQELSEDLMAINTVFICRMQGKRAAENRKLRNGSGIENKQNSSILQQESENLIETVDRIM